MADPTDLILTFDSMNFTPSWRDLCPATAGLPNWLPRVALADRVSVELLSVAETSVGATCPPGGCGVLLARLVEAGLFLETAEATAPGTPVLRPDIRKAMLTELELADNGLAGVRGELIRAGLGQPTPGLAAQLANWAFESRDWASLEEVWLTHSPADLVADPRVRAAYAETPTEERSTRPVLTYAAALAAGYDPVMDRLDLDVMTGALVRDGRSLHARWATKKTPQAQVFAGSLWMLAQATLPEWVDDPQLESAEETYQKIGHVIRDSLLSGGAVGSRALAFFHSTASLMAVLRADWDRARRDAELAMNLSDNCALPGFLAAMVLAKACSASGNTQYFAIAEKFLARHAAHNCRVASWMEPAFHLTWADAATRRLDRELAEHYLRLHEEEGAISRWFSGQPMAATVISAAAIVWDDPERALGKFDSIIANSGFEVDRTTPWGPLLLRTRAELLMRLGAVNRAEQIVADLLENADDPVSAVPAARFQLCAGDYEKAVTKADEGIYTLWISLTDRAHLYAVKSAALLLGGHSAELVAGAATAACVVCEQAGSLLPFAMLPPAVRTTLVVGHQPHEAGKDCFLIQARNRGAFDTLQDSSVAAQALVRLTPREEVLLPLLATSATVQEIANQQFVSVNTVRKQVVGLREKLGVASRSDLIRRAQELGLLSHHAKPVGRS